MLIRLATLADIPAILKLIEEVVPLMRAAGNNQWDDTYPNAQVFEKDIANNELWVATEAAGIAGVIAITTDQSPEYADAGWDINETTIVVHRLAVSIHHQGKGVAALMMHQAEQVAKNSGLDKVRVDTNVVNKATNNLFPKLGYKYAGEIDLNGKPGMRFSCYEKVLFNS